MAVGLLQKDGFMGKVVAAVTHVPSDYSISVIFLYRTLFSVEYAVVVTLYYFVWFWRFKVYSVYAERTLLICCLSWK